MSYTSKKGALCTKSATCLSCQGRAPTPDVRGCCVQLPTVPTRSNHRYANSWMTVRLTCALRMPRPQINALWSEQTAEVCFGIVSWDQPCTLVRKPVAKFAVYEVYLRRVMAINTLGCNQRLRMANILNDAWCHRLSLLQLETHACGAVPCKQYGTTISKRNKQ